MWAAGFPITGCGRLIYDTGINRSHHTCASGNNLPNSTKVFSACVGSIRLLQISCRCRFDKARRLGGIAAMRVIALATIAIPRQWFSSTCMKTRCPVLAYVKFSIPEPRYNGQNCGKIARPL